MSIKTLKWTSKLFIIRPDPFISQSSPDHTGQPIIDFSYYEISGPDICSLLCDFYPFAGSFGCIIWYFNWNLENMFSFYQKNNCDHWKIFLVSKSISDKNQNQFQTKIKMLLTAEILPLTKYVSENTLLQWLLWFRSKCTSGLDGCKMYCSKKERNKKSHNCKKKMFSRTKHHC